MSDEEKRIELLELRVRRLEKALMDIAHALGEIPGSGPHVNNVYGWAQEAEKGVFVDLSDAGPGVTACVEHVLRNGRGDDE